MLIVKIFASEFDLITGGVLNQFHRETIIKLTYLIPALLLLSNLRYLS